MVTIICGDLNLILNPELDCNQCKHVNNTKSHDTVIELMNTFDLKDTLELCTPSLGDLRGEEKIPYIKHDIISNCSIIPGYRSDHSSVKV